MDDNRATLMTRGAAVAEVDVKGLVTAWSDAARSLLGFETRDVLGRPATDLLAEPLPPDALHSLADSDGWTGTVSPAP